MHSLIVTWWELAWSLRTLRTHDSLWQTALWSGQCFPAALSPAQTGVRETTCLLLYGPEVLCLSRSRSSMVHRGQELPQQKPEACASALSLGGRGEASVQWRSTAFRTHVLQWGDTRYKSALRAPVPLGEEIMRQGVESAGWRGLSAWERRKLRKGLASWQAEFQTQKLPGWKTEGFLTNGRWGHYDTASGRRPSSRLPKILWVASQR